MLTEDAEVYLELLEVRLVRLDRYILKEVSQLGIVFDCRPLDLLADLVSQGSVLLQVVQIGPCDLVDALVFYLRKERFYRTVQTFERADVCVLGAP